MSNVLSAVSQFFVYSLMAIFTQNAVFSRAFGVSRLMKLVDDDATDSIIFAALICVVQLLAAPLAFLGNNLIASLGFRDYLRPVVLVVCMVISFIIVLFGVIFLLRTRAKAIITVLPMASFNCCVMGTLLITTTQGFTFLQTMGFALGSGLGYAVAVWLVTEGKRRIESEAIPSIFRGLPILLLYVGIIALAVYGFTGHMVTF